MLQEEGAAYHRNAWLTPFVTSLSLSTVHSAAAAGCNGQEEYCSRSYANVSVIGTHNSYGVQAGSSESPYRPFAPFLLAFAPLTEPSQSPPTRTTRSRRNWTMVFDCCRYRLT